MKFFMIWPLLLIIASNCFYNICTKSMPSRANAFLALTITYLVGALISVLMFIFGEKFESLPAELSKINWTSIILGLAIVGLEAGYVFLYRAGWKINIGALVANICLAIALVFIGKIFYHESISLKQIAGVIVCIAGLFLMAN